LVPLSAVKINEEFEKLQSSSGWKFPDCKQLFNRLRNDPDGWTAFEKLGKRGYPQDILLISLRTMFSNMLRCWKEWDAWERKWDGLDSVSKTLRLTERKMKRHLSLSDRGPIPLPHLDDGQDGHEGFGQIAHRAECRMTEIQALLAEAATDIEHYGEMRKKWVRKVTRRDIAEKEQLGHLMRSVKARTGKWYLSDVAHLFRAGEVFTSADTLRKMLRFHTPALDMWAKTPKPENSSQKLAPNFR
jgi:hypothetical protein